MDFKTDETIHYQEGATVKQPETMGELRKALAAVFAGALNGDIKEGQGRLALNAATRITENFQAELRSRKLAHEMGLKVGELGSQPINVLSDK